VAERVVVFPVAVGNVSTSLPLFVSSNNFGDSVIGAQVRREGRMVPAWTRLSKAVPVRVLDAIFNASARAPMPAGFIRLLKLDVQGFECRALAGMSRLLAGAAVQAIKTEVSKPHLEAQGCSEGELLRQLRNASFVVSTPRRRSWSYDVFGALPWVQELVQKHKLRVAQRDAARR
jgi:FkbM family methyltransferase